MTKKAILALATGEVFEGKAFGVSGTSQGELVFNTSMSGYQEIITDPSYCKQIVTFTCPHIGNVGTNDQDNESQKSWLEGVVIRDISAYSSNWRASQAFTDYLKKQNIIAISEIDTRHLTHLLRKNGSQNACLTTELMANEAITNANSFTGLDGLDLVQDVTTDRVYEWTLSRGEWGNVTEPDEFHVVAYDFGTKHNILRLLVERGAKVTVVPANTPLHEVLALKPDGVFLSNGPGDPFALTELVENIKQLLETNMPVLGICLGYQLLCLAMGARTEKMKFGHHGSNHPIIDLKTGAVLITSQNHGFKVDETSLPRDLEITHRSLFDQSLQGIRKGNAMGFQGHPEASPGPHDHMDVFYVFAKAIVKKRSKAC